MITCFVPSFNEEENIADTVASIMTASNTTNVPVEILAVVDGGNDSTEMILNELAKSTPEVRVVVNKTNMGLGYSFRKALKLSKGDKFLIVPGDNDMSVDLLTDLFANSNRAELIMAYFLNRETRGIRRNIISNVFASIYMITFRVFVIYINGPCIYPKEKLLSLDLKSNRFSIVVEATIKLLKLGCSYYEVPGYMQKGLAGSSSLSFRNLAEVIRSYLRLFFEVNLKFKNRYSKSPQRIY